MFTSNTWYSVLTMIIKILSIFLCFLNRSNVFGSVYIPTEVEKAAKDHITAMDAAYDKQPLDKVNFLCKNDVTREIFSRFPSAEKRWKHNGESFIVQSDRMTYKIDSINIEDLLPADNGVYQCDIYLSPEQYMTVAVFSVVAGDEMVPVHLGDNLNLDCNGVPLGKLFPNATRQWTHNGKKLNSKPAADESLDLFPSSSDSSKGTWTCEVRDPETDRTWLTARYKIIMNPPLSSMQRFRRYSKTHTTETLAIIAAMCFGTVLIINLITSLLDKLKARKSKEFEYLKQRLGIDGIIPDAVPLLSPADSSSDSTSSSSDSSESGNNE